MKDNETLRRREYARVRGDRKSRVARDSSLLSAKIRIPVRLIGNEIQARRGSLRGIKLNANLRVTDNRARVQRPTSKFKAAVKRRLLKFTVSRRASRIACRDSFKVANRAAATGERDDALSSLAGASYRMRHGAASSTVASAGHPLRLRRTDSEGGGGGGGERKRGL